MLWICLPYAGGGVVLDKTDRITQAPPIFRWMVGKSLKEIEKWVRGEKGSSLVLWQESCQGVAQME